MKGKILKITTLFSIVFLLLLGVTINSNIVYAAVESTDVVKIGDEGYATLKEALDVANSSDTPTTITLLSDITVSEKLTISKDVTIEGSFSIIRASDDATTPDVDETYTGTIFTVSTDATLTLDGGVTIDGANEWIFKETEFFEKYQYVIDYENGVLPEGSEAPSNSTGFDFVTLEEGAPLATGNLIYVAGELVLNEATLTNHCASGEINTIKLVSGSTATLNDGAKITRNAIASRGTAIGMSDNTNLYINDGAEISYNYAAYNGGSIFNNGGVITMNGGKIYSNYGVRTNGVALMLYGNDATLILKGGEICSNVGIPASGATHSCAIYLHSNCIMEMNGGSVCHNMGMTTGGIMVFRSTSDLIVTGGFIGKNKNYSSNNEIKTNEDIYNNGNTVITGGIFTQDVSDLCAPEYYFVELSAEDGTGEVLKCEGHDFVNSICRICNYTCPHTTDQEGDKPATCTSKAYCSTCQNEYGEMLPHECIYASDDELDTFTVTCGLGCGYNETIQVSAPASLLYDGTTKAVVLTGEVITMPTIVYNTLDTLAPIVAGDYTATLTYGDKSISIEYTIAPAIPVITITSPTPAIIPGTSMVLDVKIAHPDGTEVEDLPIDFVVKYQIGTDGTEYELTGTRLTIPEDVALGQTLYVYVENVAIAEKYGVGQSNILTLYVGQIDYSGDIEAVEEALQSAIDTLTAAMESGDSDLNAKVVELQNALINVNNVLTTLPEEYATKAELSEVKTVLEETIASAKAEVLATTNEAIEAAKAELEVLIDEKADAEEVIEALIILAEAIEVAEQAAKDYAELKDSELQTLLEAAIDEAKEEAIGEASEALETAKAELELAIATKADAEEVQLAIEMLSGLIELAEQAAKDFATTSDEALKVLLEGKIEAAKTEVLDAASEALAAAKAELQAAIDTKADAEEVDAALEELAEAIELAEQAAKDFAELKDSELQTLLEGKIEAAKEEAITTASEALAETKAELEDLIDTKADKTTLEEKVAELTEAIALAEQTAKDFAVAEDEILKAYVDAEIKAANDLIEAVEARVTANEIAIEKINAAIEELRKVDEEHAEALAEAVCSLSKTIEEIGNLSTLGDEILDAKLTEARDILIARIEKLKRDLNTTKEELEAAIKAGDSDLESKISDLSKSLDAMKAALEAADEKNRAELEAQIDAGDKALEAAINEVNNRLNNVESELDTMNQELQAKDQELQKVITIVCIVLGGLGVVFIGFVVWYIIDRKKFKN